MIGRQVNFPAEERLGGKGDRSVASQYLTHVLETGVHVVAPSVETSTKTESVVSLVHISREVRAAHPRSPGILWMSLNALAATWKTRAGTFRGYSPVQVNQSAGTSAIPADTDYWGR
jgi:hypothetical protein